MKILIKTMQVLILALFATSTFAHIGPQNSKKPDNSKDPKVNFREDCQPGVAETDQSINNVRARLTTGGDVWWNRQEGLYVVPKPAQGQDPVSSIFAGGVWVGGTTRAQSLKLAGVTYRSLANNFDWYPGPLDEMGVTDDAVCSDWDQFFHVLATDISKHNDNWESDPDNYNCDSIPDAVKYWPGKGNPFWREKYDFDLPDQPLGAFFDQGPGGGPGDGIYNPCDGDFPTIEIEGCFGDRRKAKELIPDEMYFWIYNDNGGPHRLTAGDAIQMEVQVQAFAYATNDEVNDMTFQRYRLLNKANEDLIDCYFAMWVDPDLGCAFDDYSGTDNTLDASGKPRSLAYTYNEDAVDGNNGANCSGGVNTYEFEVPIIGTDYFRGPLGPRIFSRNDDGELILDSLGNKILEEPIPGTGVVDTFIELGMTSCIFTFNCSSNPPNPATCDPEIQDEQFYNNMRGLWRTGEPITAGGTGYNPGSTDTVKFMFSDPPSDPTGWSMCNVGLSEIDTRTLQATGPLLLVQGATNELIIGVVWVPDLEYPCPDITRLQSADDIAQALFDNCFDITDGPDAPDLCGIELDKKLIMTLTNSQSSNNYREEYEEVDLNYSGPEDGDNTYNFEGYKVYQLRDAGVSAQELGDIEKARLVLQVDVNNDVSEIFNWSSQINPLIAGERLWTFTREVDGENSGIQRAFEIIEDQFASGIDRSLINHKQYHFMVVAYGYNNWENFDPNTEVGQRRAYLEGRRNVKTYTFVPRPIVYENLNTDYGDGAVITRIHGQGNNGGFLDLADGEAQSLVDGTHDGRITYKEGAGPFEVKIFNPLEVKDGRYSLEFVGEFDDRSSVCALLPGARWVLTNLDTGEEIASERTIDEINEQILPKQGFSISLSQPDEPGSNETDRNGGIGISFDYEEGGEAWFMPVTNGGPESLVNQLQQIFLENLQTGIQYDPNSVLNFYESGLPEDPDNRLGNLGGGSFIPFYNARVQTTTLTGDPVTPYLSPGQAGLRFARSSRDVSLTHLNNVDIVFTDNKDLWSRCIVVETANEYHYDGFGLDTETGAERLQLIEKPSVDRNGNPDNSGTEGFSWFPGYAIDVETGQRLNIFFGENTIYTGANADILDDPGIANDMIWNPSSQFLGSAEPLSDFRNLVMGGQHFIYVTRQVYDECQDLADEFSNNIIGFENLGAITWTCFPMVSASTPLKSMEDGLIPTDLTVKLRVNNTFSNEVPKENLSRLKRCDALEELPLYEFEISGKEADQLTEDEYEGALANVNVVPNPYYAYSSYETSELVNTIKITNLPDRATVTIYTIDGKFIRQYDRDERRTIKADPSAAIGFSQTSPDLEWDLKNHKQIPIASGVYLIHVVAPELNEERVIKWFGVNRQFDPTGL
jgi:hypothetical protein